MAVTRTDRIVLVAAAMVALGVPLAILGLAADPAAVAEPEPPLLSARPAAAVRSVYARALFAAGPAMAEPTETAPADAPELAGIVGRIGSDAVALVRAADGRTRTLAIGDSVDGWTLDALTIDAAAFRRGDQRARVALPAGEEN